MRSLASLGNFTKVCSVAIVLFFDMTSRGFSQSAQQFDVERVQQEIKKDVVAANHCETNADCTSIFLGCPFGCEEYINKSELQPLRKRLDEAQQTLAAMNVPECRYSCAKRMDPVCRDHQCVASDADLMREP